MLEAIAIPILQDNYIWLIRQADNPNVIAVDPGTSSELQDYLTSNQLQLSKVLITHQHGDHINGLTEIKHKWPEAEIIVPALPFQGERLAGTACQGGEQFSVFEDVTLQVFHVPGHTLNHLIYLFTPTDGHPILCCGDTLFSAGCGRIFEGSPAQMYSSLQLINQLPENTVLCPTHEYTLSNLKFARVIEPENSAIIKQQANVELLRQQQLPSLPVTLAAERSYNPFLRCEIKELQQRWQQDSALGLFTFLRNWKNNF